MTGSYYSPGSLNIDNIIRASQRIAETPQQGVDMLQNFAQSPYGGQPSQMNMDSIAALGMINPAQFMQQTPPQMDTSAWQRVAEDNSIGKGIATAGGAVNKALTGIGDCRHEENMLAKKQAHALTMKSVAAGTASDKKIQQALFLRSLVENGTLDAQTGINRIATLGQDAWDAAFPDGLPGGEGPVEAPVEAAPDMAPPAYEDPDAGITGAIPNPNVPPAEPSAGVTANGPGVGSPQVPQQITPPAQAPVPAPQGAPNMPYPAPPVDQSQVIGLDEGPHLLGPTGGVPDAVPYPVPPPVQDKKQGVWDRDYQSDADFRKEQRQHFEDQRKWEEYQEKKLKERTGAEVQAQKQAGAAADNTVRKRLMQQEAATVLNALERSPNAAEWGNILGATGLSADTANRFSSNAADGIVINSALEAIRANIGFDRLSSMRRESAHGGAVGQVSNFEQRLLQAAMGSLSMNLGRAELKMRVQRYLEIQDAIINPAKSKLAKILNKWDRKLGVGSLQEDMKRVTANSYLREQGISLDDADAYRNFVIPDANGGDTLYNDALSDQVIQQAIQANESSLQQR